MNVVTREEWAAARSELLEREKQLTRLGDELAAQRRELPWLRVEKDYYPSLDRVPGGRDEGEAFQTWLRRHDEYEMTVQ
jgi:predicted dithiol-disulfide oxidoreductase (DUF899 family)